MASVATAIMDPEEPRQQENKGEEGEKGPLYGTPPPIFSGNPAETDTFILAFKG